MRLKKVALAILTGAMVLGSSLTAFAAEAPSATVTGSYTGDSGKPVYSCSYSFGSMHFNYSGGSQGTWDPKTHEFSGEASSGGWTCADGADEVTIINHSNGAIAVRMEFQSAKEGIKFGFSQPTFDIETAVGTTYANAPQKTVTVGPLADCGGLSEGETNVTLGTVLVHVSAK